MKLRNATWIFTLATGIGCLILHLQPPARAQASEALVLVVNKGNSAAAGMSLADARKLMLGETSGWRNGSKVVVILEPAGNPERAAILKKVCGMSESAYTRYQMQAAFTGQSAATIKEVPSDAAVKSAVHANPGAFGFLRKSQLDDSVTAALVLE